MKKKLIASMIFLIVCVISTIIYAAIDAKVQINASAETVKPGDEVTFTIKVKNIVSENGANGLEGTFSYDTDKFEAISNANVTKAGPWDVVYYNGKIIAEGLTAINEDTNVISIKLKVKEDSSLVGKTASVSLNNTVVYNTDKVDLGTASASVKIGGNSSNTDTTPKPTSTPTAEPDATPTEKPATTPTATPNGGSESTPTPSTKPNNTGAPTTTAKPNNGVDEGDHPITNIDTNISSGSGTSNSGSSSSGKTNSTTSLNSLPKAGIGSTIAILSLAAVSLGAVSYIKLRKYREI